jgi:Fe-S-cluster-containing dehydrogenase component/formate-dependent nitrite reductase membrane component NrfD
MAGAVALPSTDSPASWVKVVDHSRCIGCHACSTACKSENQVPLGVQRTYVKYVDVGVFPLARRAFQVTRCNQCDRPPCAAICPTAAMHRRPDGIVDFDKAACIGCKACMAACPYDAIFINPEDHAAEKCNFCAHRLALGLEPACVVVCPTEALLVGDVNDRASRVARLLGREPLAVRRPEKDTRPKVFYRGAHQATLDPLAARRPDGGIFLWSEQGRGPGEVGAGVTPGAATMTDAVLAYDVSHRAPWDWRVSLYTWTKSMAAGAYLVAALLVAFGALASSGALWQWVGPLLSLAFLGATGLVLILDLERPARFYLLFTRPQWTSWLARGTVILSAFGAVLGAHLLAAIAGNATVARAAAWPGVPLAAMTAGYTAYLFAQARARDFWQNPLLPVHLLAQAVLAGAAVLLIAALRFDADAVPLLARTTAWACIAHLALVACDLTVPHPTAHAKLAAHEMTRGRFAAPFWIGVGLVVVGALAASLGPAGALAALLGLLAHEHAVVQAGQSAPLA